MDIKNLYISIVFRHKIATGEEGKLQLSVNEEHFQIPMMKMTSMNRIWMISNLMKVS